jgi:hypothetical protein
MKSIVYVFFVILALIPRGWAGNDNKSSFPALPNITWMLYYEGLNSNTMFLPDSKESSDVDNIYSKGMISIPYNFYSKNIINNVNIVNPYNFNSKNINNITTKPPYLMIDFIPFLTKSKIGDTTQIDVQILIPINYSLKDKTINGSLVQEFKNRHRKQQSMNGAEIKYINLETDYEHVLYENESLLEELKKKSVHAIFIQLPPVLTNGIQLANSTITFNIS